MIGAQVNGSYKFKLLILVTLESDWIECSRKFGTWSEAQQAALDSDIRAWQIIPTFTVELFNV
jgi:hypothetical protein